MKLLLIAALAILGTANAGVIAEPEPETERRFMYFPDDQGKPHLIDLQEAGEPVDPRNVERITFNLFTRNNPRIAQTLELNSIASITRSHFSNNRPTRFVTHGWLSSQRSDSCVMVRNAYIESGDYNVIVVDWSTISYTTIYLSAANGVPAVADRVASFINFLRLSAGLNLATTKIIGHSLGGHVAGIAAHRTSGTLQGVVALDPAGPGFYTARAGEGVTASDAAHVQVIHTNGGTLGLMRRAGDSDFYPNGGRSQPGCGIDLYGTCAHSRCYHFFSESIRNPLGFRASNNNNVFMGGRILTTATGRFELTTRNRSPYAMG